MASAQPASGGAGLITKLVVVVAASLLVVAAGLVGLVVGRDAMPSPQEKGDQVRAAAAAAPVNAAAAAASQENAAIEAVEASESAAITGTAGLTNVAAGAAAKPIRTKNLFVGAIAAPGAGARPSSGGIRLASTGRGALAGKVIVIDPGHNGVAIAKINNRLVPDGTGRRKACNTTGTSTNAKYAEHAHNWAVGTRLAAVLKARGATVVLTRPNNRGVGPCVDQRAAIANTTRANLVISIHADGAPARARGFHVIRSTRMAGGTDITSASARASTIVRDAYAKGTGLPRSTYLGAGTAITPRGDIAGLNLSRVPAVMLEAGNMRNAAEAKLLASPSFQDKQAYALAAGAQTFLRR